MRRRLPVKASAKQSIDWFKHNEPFIYRVARRRVELMQRGNRGLHGFGAIDLKSMFTSLTETVKELAPAYLQARQQKKIMDVQLTRAEQGLPPMQVADYAPVIKIAPEVTPQTEEAITRVAEKTLGGTLKNLAIPFGLGFLLLMLMRQKPARGR